MQFEVCVESLEGAMAAYRGGATRLELCSSLIEGGLTPSAGLIREVKRHCPLPVHVMVRPRSGDFLHTPHELEVMLSDIEFCHFAEVDGLVFGVLDSQGEVDLQAMGKLMQAAKRLPVTFHRAFDVCRTPVRALEQLIELGVKRLLTSGQQPTAFEGRQLIAALVRQARDRLVVLAGSGVNPQNVIPLLQATQVREVHFSARSGAASHPVHVQERLKFGVSEEHWVTSEEKVRAVVKTVLG
ncbi:copper homeostasis protein CutC [Deinococcus cellulosilyticus]|uniref:PF03932 family protein CutC n=1 Tax=Deinococcus cellulosilyticus (strain DSM 18568 / NBRC 106333 / KACC 11606 / 5516J-15) TaxID=1223518 RepID=A0A511N0W2_DEIC1|nr:copper homeostasis protein CutC [Deinococcus cellulosilyticus]GEM46101.1 copper homeostasis protein CutC [Deinococcus cellulosilyticus NBRC 106333 = KACC 11606]